MASFNSYVWHNQRIPTMTGDGEHSPWFGHGHGLGIARNWALLGIASPFPRDVSKSRLQSQWSSCKWGMQYVLPSGKLRVCELEHHHVEWEISLEMAIFNSYVKFPEGNPPKIRPTYFYGKRGIFFIGRIRLSHVSVNPKFRCEATKMVVWTFKVRISV